MKTVSISVHGHACLETAPFFVGIKLKRLRIQYLLRSN
jgi:hypothetical protein